MSKIKAEFNTVTKEFILSKDGEVMENVQYVTFGPNYDDGFRVQIVMRSKDEKNDMTQCLSLEASQYIVPAKLDDDVRAYLEKLNK